MSPTELKTEIEETIDQARAGLTEGIDAFDRRLREELDLPRIASEHAPQLMVAGAAVGFVLGAGVKRALLRTIQIGVPIALAIGVAKKARELENENPEEE